MAAEDDRLYLQNAAEQGNPEAKDSLAETEAAEAKTREQQKIELRNQKIRSFSGKKYSILDRAPTSDPKRFVCLLGTLGENPDYSLWNFELIDEDNIDLWPYDEDDSTDLMIQMMKNYTETASNK